MTWLTFVAASAFANVYFKRKVNKVAGSSISDAFKTQGESLARIEKHILGKEQVARLNEPKEATRVYAVLLQRGIETRFVVQPANTFEEMSGIVQRELGIGWMILMSAFCDVLGWKETHPAPIESIETKVAAVEPPIANFIHGLEYSRDKFADSPAQKAAVDEIIKKIKTQHL